MRKIDFLATDGVKLNGLIYECQDKGKEKTKQIFIHLVSVKTFLRYARDNNEIDFAKYGEDLELKKLNNITSSIIYEMGKCKRNDFATSR